ncbi:hypothetical protein [Pseudonocardia hydrocarbonoxydans]|uniref:Uncharacterized protein n=1 Tax=Pseudonocardia hydrocarbonoxydans TaxID=76726 RepID=A0A4Y3WWM1_9PSEU|nr:hypothetical protein [Pseudonocardia hydrocarbonoxydans]GEC22958.1 hypothetical protein PHY01_52410 [Pseudonocardia hydrocarbonoxydans]
MAAVPYPDDGHLLKIGRLAYAVTYLEGMVLFDLPGTGAQLPTAITLAKLGGKPTGLIARLLRDHAPHLADPALREYLVAAGDALAAVATIRNAVLHARPATIDDQQRLNRAHAGEHFVITDAWLDAKTAEIEQYVRTVSDVRERRRSAQT